MIDYPSDRQAFKCTGLLLEREKGAVMLQVFLFVMNHRIVITAVLSRSVSTTSRGLLAPQATLAITTLVSTDWMGRMRQQAGDAFRVARSEAESNGKLKMEKEMSSISASRHIRVIWNPYQAVQSTALSYLHA